MPWQWARPRQPETASEADVAEPDDEALVAAARLDARAFDALYLRYAGPVYRYCHLRLGSREAAEDAASAVFVKALSALPDYREGNFAGWLYRITANTVIDAQRRTRPTVAIEATHEPRDPTPTPDDLALLRLDHEALLAALARLPNDQRATIELQLAGWSGERIAAALNRSPEAARMLRHRAVARLRQLLSDPSHVPDDNGGRR